jgi:predicted membrane chloride channel (bestrophin family)
LRQDSVLGSVFAPGSVIWRIWPTVVTYTGFSSLVVMVTMENRYNLAIPSVLVMVLGVVIGFVISYRFSSGYERYWSGRSAWTAIIRNSRTFARMVWLHVPPRVELGTPEQTGITEEKAGVGAMEEKKVAMNMIRAFSLALKHHLRGEVSPYYDDLYPLIQPLLTKKPSLQSHEPAGSNDPSAPLKRISSSNDHTAPLSLSFGNASTRYTPTIAGDGQNIPEEILLYLSEWCSILEVRGVVPGGTLGTMMGCITGFEESLTSLEAILTTPLPFAYSSHIRHTVWLYLFFLPFQLVSQFGWFTIPGVAVAAFIYLGFMAAGDEIEQPFGYDRNDLDLDLFCHEIIGRDLDRVMDITGGV